MTRPILEKLGWKAGMGTAVWRVPDALADVLAPLGEAASEAPSFRIAFARDAAELREAARAVASQYQAGGHLWLCYPKKSGRIRSDITRDIGWEPIEALDLIGVTQIALDADWSALRFRLRSEIPTLIRKTPNGAR